MGRKLTTEDFVKKAKTLHGNSFDYSLVEYKKYKTKIEIICNSHGKFYQTPSDHLQGAGCPYCKAEKQSRSTRLTTEQFVVNARNIHGSLYDYSRVNYVNSQTKVDIVCKEHGSFWQTPNNHLSQTHKCPKCSTGNISNLEKMWISTLPDTVEHHIAIEINGSRFIVDGYDATRNTIYEFHGDFWHGNPAKYSENDINPVNKISFGELYERTRLRTLLFRESGYEVVEMWETDFLTSADKYCKQNYLGE